MAYAKMSDELKKQWQSDSVKVEVNKNDSKIVWYDPSIENQLKRKDGVKYIPISK